MFSLIEAADFIFENDLAFHQNFLNENMPEAMYDPENPTWNPPVTQYDPLSSAVEPCDLFAQSPSELVEKFHSLAPSVFPVDYPSKSMTVARIWKCDVCFNHSDKLLFIPNIDEALHIFETSSNLLQNQTPINLCSTNSQILHDCVFVARFDNNYTGFSHLFNHAHIHTTLSKLFACMEPENNNHNNVD